MVERTAKGRWAKGGGSPNPAGRPKGAIADLQREMRTHAPLACKVLVEICGNLSAKDSDRIAAAREILDRGFGRPVQQVDAALVVKRLDEMDRDQLLALQARMLGIADEADQLDRTGTMN